MKNKLTKINHYGAEYLKLRRIGLVFKQPLKCQNLILVIGKLTVATRCKRSLKCALNE